MALALESTLKFPLHFFVLSGPFTAMILVKLFFVPLWLISVIYAAQTPNCTESRLSHLAEQSKAKDHIYDSLKSIENGGERRNTCFSPLQSETCCSLEAEDALREFSLFEVKRLIRNVHEKMEKTFAYLNDTFIKLLQDTINAGRIRVINIFMKRYQDVFSDWSKVINPLYDAMLEFLNTREINIDDSLTTARNNLIIITFKLLENIPSLTSDQRECILSVIDTHGAFKKAMESLRQTIQKAMNMSSALVIGIETGARAVFLLSEICPSDSCLTDLAQIQHCSLCAGYVNVKPCLSLCLETLPGCVGDLNILNFAFGNYLNGVKNMMMKVEKISPETAIHDVGIKLANFQISLVDALLGNVGTKCGFAVSKRNQRAVSLGVRGKEGFSMRELNPPEEMEFAAQLEFGLSVIGQFHGALGLTVKTVCQSISAKNGTMCWKGTTAASYRSKVKKLKASGARQNLLQDIVRDLRNATNIMAYWNNLRQWKINPARSHCESASFHDSPQLGLLCPEDDEDCWESMSGSGESGSAYLDESDESGSRSVHARSVNTVLMSLSQTVKEPDILLDTSVKRNESGSGHGYPRLTMKVVTMQDENLRGGAVGYQSLFRTFLICFILLAAV